MQARFTHAIKFVADMDNAIAFYRDTLEFASSTLIAGARLPVS